MSHSVVKPIPVAGKMVISVKLIASIAWIFDSEHVPVVAFSEKTLLKADDSISSSAFHTVSLSISRTHANRSLSFAS